MVYNTNVARREGNKTDKIDTSTLVKKLSYYILTGRRKEDLPTVYIPDVERFGSSEFYHRVKMGKSVGKPRIALIRKILVSAYHMLKRKEMFHCADDELYFRKLKEFHKEMERIKGFIRKERKVA